MIHNPGNVFHFELQWIGTTARRIDDQIRTWSKSIDRYGLKLVEAYVGQIIDVHERNAFQSCFPIRLAIQPPIVMDLERKIAEGTQTTHYFEYAILRKFGYVLDVEASDLYPQHVDVVYSYRHSPYRYTQFVHRSGMGFVQIIGASQGFVFLTNRLMGPGRIMRKDYQPAAIAEQIRMELAKFCSNKKELQKFYDDELDKWYHYNSNAPEEPPPLSI
jgi:DEP domain-containing protein 5